MHFRHFGGAMQRSTLTCATAFYDVRDVPFYTRLESHLLRESTASRDPRERLERCGPLLERIERLGRRNREVKRAFWTSHDLYPHLLDALDSALAETARYTAPVPDTPAHLDPPDEPPGRNMPADPSPFLLRMLKLYGLRLRVRRPGLGRPAPIAAR
ncbi:hypothetical protein BDK51DRAFT_33341, partial [Blyttiomyces helicus]